MNELTGNRTAGRIETSTAHTMKKETQTVWRDKKGDEVLVSKGNGKFYVPLSTIDAEQARELAAACLDATNSDQQAKSE